MKKPSKKRLVRRILKKSIYGSAGIQADLKVLAQMGIYGAAAITSLTRQTTEGVLDVAPLPAKWVGQQVEDVLVDLQPAGVKTGMLGNAETAFEVSLVLSNWFKHKKSAPPSSLCNLPVLVIDPVMASGGGVSLYEGPGARVLMSQLFPLANLITPNVPEANRLTGINILDLEDAKRAARRLRETGADWILIKGGHLEEKTDTVTDVLYNGQEFFLFSAPRIPSLPLHGTGCSLASFITALLVQGLPMEKAVGEGVGWLRKRIAKPLEVGRGRRVVCQSPRPPLLT